MSDDIAMSDLCQEVPGDRMGFKNPMNTMNELNEASQHVEHGDVETVETTRNDLGPGAQGNIVIELPDPESPKPTLEAPASPREKTGSKQPIRTGRSWWFTCAIRLLIFFLALAGIMIIVFLVTMWNDDDKADADDDISDSETNGSTTSMAGITTSDLSGVESTSYALGCRMTFDFNPICSWKAGTLEGAACSEFLGFGLARIDEEEVLRRRHVSVLYLNVTDPSRVDLSVSFEFEEDSLSKAESFQQHFGNMTSSAVVSHVNERILRHVPRELLNSMDSVSCCVSQMRSGSWAQFLTSGSDVFPQWLRIFQADDPQLAQEMLDIQTTVATCLLPFFT